MEFDQTGNHQLLIAKQFIQKYFKIIIVLSLFVMLAFLGGWYWQKKQANIANNSSQIFQEMIFADLQQDTKTASDKGDRLIADYSSSPYSQLASLLLAKIAINENNFELAEEKLRWVMARKKSHKLAGCIATVRLAGVLQQQGKLDEALKLVSKDPEKAYVPLYAQIRGDLYAAKGDIEQARKSYMLALQSLPANSQAPLLQMKLLDLGGDVNA